jgi:type I restriction enzyme S subunit
MSQRFWGRNVTLSDYVELNPRVNLLRGANVPFVSMDIISPGTRKVYPVQERPASGSGSKFGPGDTLFARITPCLENGKIAQYAGDRAGMGSTEFFVLRARDDISDPAFVYYFSQNPDLRSAAEKSMSGASGRQRAVISSLSEFECEFPPLAIQKRIAGILSAYDELIEISQRRIKILEAMARGLYREWFVYFRFPGHENHPRVASALGEIPQGWEVKTIQDFGKVVTGKTPSKANAGFFGVDVPFVKTPDMHGNLFVLGTNESLSTAGANSQSNKTLPVGSICVSCIGTIGVVSITTEESQTNQQINSVVLAKNECREFLFLRLQEAKQTLENLGSNGATMGNVNKSKFETMEIVAPPDAHLFDFHRLTQPMFNSILNLTRQIQNLRQTRDLLLPRLLSGQINVEPALP